MKKTKSDRQQKKNVKQRKAKAKAAHDAVFRSWIDKRQERMKQSSRPSSPRLPFPNDTRMNLSDDQLERLFGH